MQSKRSTHYAVAPVPGPTLKNKNKKQGTILGTVGVCVWPELQLSLAHTAHSLALLPSIISSDSSTFLVFFLGALGERLEVDLMV